MINKFSSILKLGFAASLIAALSSNVSAQAISVRDVNNYLKKRDDGKNVSLFHRLELSYGMTYGRASLAINDRLRDPSNFNVITGRSRATTFNYRSASGYAGVYFPLSYFSNNTMMALSTGFYGVANVWDLGNISLDDTKVTKYEAADMFFGLPVGVDFIYGGEATMNKQDKVTLRGGVGLMPYFAVGELADGSQNYSKVGFHPYVKAEIGFFAAVEWKIKGMIVAGSRTIYDYNTGNPNLQDSDYYYSMNMKIRPTYTVGIAVFPFSFGWENDKW